MMYFVGVGPGDPELVTFRAARILQEADAIAIPDSGKDSVVWKIAGKWMEGKPVLSLPMPMKGKKEDWEAAHSRAVEQLLRWLEEYETIAYPVLGDPGIYASSSYLMRRIAPHHPCRVAPGIPAMCAAAAELGIPLCEQGESLAVMDAQRMDTCCPNENVVIMKGGRDLPSIQEALAGREAYVVRNLGMQDQWSGRIRDYPSDGSSYFTTVIVKQALTSGEPALAQRRAEQN